MKMLKAAQNEQIRWKDVKEILGPSTMERLNRRAYLERYEALPEDFKEFVVGVSKALFLDSEGFTVYLLLKTSHAYQEQRSFVRLNQKRLVQFVCSEITQGLYFMRRIGDLNLYYLSSILLSRRNEVEFNFRIRKEIEQVLLD